MECSSVEITFKNCLRLLFGKVCDICLIKRKLVNETQKYASCTDYVSISVHIIIVHMFDCVIILVDFQKITF